MHELTNIAEKYKNATDKCPCTTYKIKHSYTEFYGPLFHPLRHNQLNVLEIGVRWGGSILMWRDYFKNSQIYGLDQDFRDLRVNISDPRIHEVKANAYSSKATEYFEQKNIKLDVIIDDGSHNWFDQLYVLNEYKEILNPDGIICVEDVISEDSVKRIFDGFTGDRDRLSLVDRTMCSTAYFDERIILYHG
jgi:hypothetical protein